MYEIEYKMSRDFYNTLATVRTEKGFKKLNKEQVIEMINKSFGLLRKVKEIRLV